MATIKSFTSLEQSRKLAEILPLESADMYYEWPNKKVHFKDDKYSGMGFSCWSLTALSEFILPSVVDDGNNYKFYLSKDGLDRWIAYYKSDNVSIYICEESYNMIDVIFEMVCWLKTEKYI